MVIFIYQTRLFGNLAAIFFVNPKEVAEILFETFFSYVKTHYIHNKLFALAQFLRFLQSQNFYEKMFKYVFQKNLENRPVLL